MKLTESIRYIIKRLNPVYSQHEAEAIARLLIEHLGYDSGPMAILNDLVLSDEEILQIENWIAELLLNKPIQYILGYAWFMDRKIFVNESCLIPRQETEELVNLILKNSNKNKQTKILDIGTGSACIPISLADTLKNSHFYAADISSEAIQIAKRNSFINNADIEFILDDILNPDYAKYPSFDIIISNPPYVRLQEKQYMSANVLEYEPSLALFVSDENPLKYYKAIIEFTHTKLNNGGRLYFEINEVFGKEIKILLSQNGFKDIQIIKDIHEKDRIIKAQKT